jgi:8-oxo-dGTP diphosphatase
MQHPPSIKSQTSAGGVVYRKRAHKGPEVILIAVKGGSVWTLPKGLIAKGEKPEEAALREVSEETGVKARLIEKIGDISYWYYATEENTKYRKTVHFYLMEYLSGSTEEHDFEVEDSRWFPLEEAMQKIVYKGDKSILEKAKEMLEKGV